MSIATKTTSRQAAANSVLRFDALSAYVRAASPWVVMRTAATTGGGVLFNFIPSFHKP
jgi:hypothetical protein